MRRPANLERLIDEREDADRDIDNDAADRAERDAAEHERAVS